MLKRFAVFFSISLAALALVFFAWFAWHYVPIVDDLLFRAVLKEKTVAAAALHFYGNFNGRLASHFFLCAVFRVFEGREPLFFIYHFLMLAAFVFALAGMLRGYLRRVRGRVLTFGDALWLSAFVTSFFFFFFFEGRVEVWFWVSATGVHLISLILAMTGFAVLLGEAKTAWKCAAGFGIFFLTGGFSESFALLYGLLLLILLLRLRSTGIPALLFSLAGLAAGILLNVLSPGIGTRLGWLPDFDVLQSVKNTFHAMALPFLRWKHLPFKLLLIAGLFFYAKWKYHSALPPLKSLLREFLFLLAFIFIAFFLPSFLLSDVAPDRTTSIGYLAGVLFLFDVFIFRTPAFNKAGTAA